MIVVGGGIVGLACAWWLQARGHAVLLLDPAQAAAADEGPADGAGPGEGPERSGSLAALGVLMADSFHRERGRAWDLRQCSLERWTEWRHELAERGHPIPYRSGVLLLAADGDEEERLAALGARKRALGLPLEPWDRRRLEQLEPTLPQPSLAGLHSGRDGQLDPGSALAALAADGRARGLSLREEAAVALRPDGGGWRVELAGGGVERAAWVVLAAGTASGALLEAAAGGAAGLDGGRRVLEPVLGQALELELDTPLPTHWPGAVVWRGVNLVPRPDLEGGRRLWLGATLEPGRRADPDQLRELRDLGGAAPEWLRQARVVRRWQGLRPRPLGRPAPLLEQVAPGLLLASGHYRNGILLAPATAAWVAEQIEARPTDG
ncbi:FAD-dependent oxidoreductase [Cyanobium gracile UHCC 0139]|uniref:FAD-dependent oxidoreductase n=1 Tax=Cyanobium gracile UHCC 0139 TaxID=3110308 RepID=A0ABU5RQS6_9CYAN|nr:FAD-dependent oxidoreductase [Cyanobium gracile]MEA5390113.1 FAD-dependent oxidoreductase [Cyanobium gracile UHCC 0139]